MVYLISGIIHIRKTRLDTRKIILWLMYDSGNDKLIFEHIEDFGIEGKVCTTLRHMLLMGPADNSAAVSTQITLL